MAENTIARKVRDFDITLHTATADHNGGNSHVIGAGGDGAGLQYFLGSMCEVLYYNRALSAADLATVHKYLSKKWGFTLS